MDGVPGDANAAGRREVLAPIRALSRSCGPGGADGVKQLHHFVGGQRFGPPLQERLWQVWKPTPNRRRRLSHRGAQDLPPLAKEHANELLEGPPVGRLEPVGVGAAPCAYWGLGAV